MIQKSEGEKMKLEGAIFDLDGTLLDSMSVWKTVGKDYIMSQGTIPHEDLAETFKTMSLQHAAEYCQEEYGIEKTTQEIIDGIDAMIAGFYEKEAQLKNGMKEILDDFVDKDVRMCIATANNRSLVESALKRLGIREYFKEILTCDEVGAGKEDALIYEKALECLQTKKENTLVFEDMIHAIKTAKEAGFIVVGVCEETEPDQETVKKISDYYIR